MSDLQPSLSSYYFYSNGEKVELAESEDFSAVNMRSLNQPDTIDNTTKSELALAIIAKAKYFSIFIKKQLSDESLETLTKLDLMQPVFEVDDTLMVFLPEVRVEENRDSRREKLTKYLADSDHEVEFNDKRLRTSIKLNSGSSTEAIALANELYESLDPQMVQARIVKVQTKSDLINRIHKK